MVMKIPSANERGSSSVNSARSATTPASIREEAAAWISRRDAGLKLQDDPGFQGWIERDVRHREAFAEFGAAWSWLDRPMQSGAAHDVLHELDRLERRQRQRRMTVGAVTALVLLAGVSVWTISRALPNASDRGAAATARVLAPQRQMLPDGSVAELKTGAQIDVKYSPGARRIALVHGEALFHVMKDVSRPFIVEANGIELRAVGTAFAVQLDGPAVDVVVTEGRVAIDRPNQENPTTTLPQPLDSAAPLTPSQQATITHGSSRAFVRTLSATELAARLAWRSTRLEFSGTPLAEVVTLLNQYASDRNDVRFSIGDKAIAQVKVSGLFRADNTAALLDLLDSAFGIVAEQTSDGTVLRRAPTRN